MQLDVAEGLLRAVTDADGVTVRFDHDADGNVVSITNGLGALTRFVPHVSGEVAEVATADGAVLRLRARRRRPARWPPTPPTGPSTASSGRPPGRLTATIEPNGARTTFEAGSHGETERIVDALGAAIELQHDHMARLVGLAAPGGAKWGFDYSAAGLLSLVTDPARRRVELRLRRRGPAGQRHRPAGSRGPPPPQPRPGGWSSWSTGWATPPATTTTPSVGSCGRRRPTAASPPTSGTSWSRPTAVRFPDGDTLAYAYTPAGRVRSVRTAEGRGWTNTYDAAGRLVAVAGADGGPHPPSRGTPATA